MSSRFFFSVGLVVLLSSSVVGCGSAEPPPAPPGAPIGPSRQDTSLLDALMAESTPAATTVVAEPAPSASATPSASAPAAPSTKPAKSSK